MSNLFHSIPMPLPSPKTPKTPKSSESFLTVQYHNRQETPSVRNDKKGKAKPWKLWNQMGQKIIFLHWIWGGSKFSGLACMAVSSFSYSLMGLFVKLLAVRGIPSLETVLVRCTIISVLSGWELRSSGHPLFGSPRVRRLVIARAIVGFVALSTFFYSIQALPLRDATVLNFTMPVFTSLLAAGMLGERWGAGEMAGSLCSFAGVLLVTQPNVLFDEQRGEGEGERGRGNDSPPGNDPLGVVMALMGAAMGALSYVFVRAVGKQGEPPMVCVFAFATFSAPLSALGLFFQSFKFPDYLEAMGLLAVGLTAFAAQVFLTRGLQLEKAGRATSIQYVKVLGTYILGVVFLKEVPSLFGALGALLIALSAAFLAYGSSS